MKTLNTLFLTIGVLLLLCGYFEYYGRVDTATIVAGWSLMVMGYIGGYLGTLIDSISASGKGPSRPA